ncbi:MAG TPA: transposase [Cyclobacteriaceae bacterium]|nr:transposase [Cyclobacteriaceae bacterium]
MHFENLHFQNKREVLGICLGKSENASFWMSVLTDLRIRGVDDMLISNTVIFAQSITQICLVHQIRNASCYVVWKDKREADLKLVYTSANENQAFGFRSYTTNHYSI